MNFENKIPPFVIARLIVCERATSCFSLVLVIQSVRVGGVGVGQIDATMKRLMVCRANRPRLPERAVFSMATTGHHDP